MNRILYLLRVFDWAIIVCMEKACNWFQDWTGKSCVWVYRQAECLTTLIVISLFAYGALDMDPRGLIIAAFGIYVFLAVIFKMAREPLKDAERREILRISKGFMNPYRRVPYPYLRFGFILAGTFVYGQFSAKAWSEVSYYHVWSVAFFLSALTSYVRSCDPQIGGISKFREFFEGLGMRKAQAHSANK
jgi:hypothetical protein